MQIFRNAQRGRTTLPWLDSRHSFSFAGYREPERDGFSVLRVLNDDRVVPGGGFGTHGHRDMEIVTWVLAGHLRHRDSMGNGTVLGPGGVQFMSAGTGITHSEFNDSEQAGLHFFQVWILPDRAGHVPRYGEKHFDPHTRHNRWCLIASPDGGDGSVPIHQDARILVTRLTDRGSLEFTAGAGRSVYVHVAAGALTLNSQGMTAGDGCGLRDTHHLKISATPEADVILFDLP